MLKKLFVILSWLSASACFAALDINQATEAELDSVKGIGPGTSNRILEERQKGHFKDWKDFITRVKGIGKGNAARFSAEGVTVNGQPYATGSTPAATPRDPKKTP
ncbi:helix-hairpin-helix domain-containing protein [Rhodoferax sp.]|uniref:ComEA family DNA-binding protein n=1 Tax=Rhodoferax sp. TaxID=50421 RepID=UPI002608527A|nr:helix-hairpin-helix domain-containing protein [Rhodoferax sp.]MDD2925893.1 helix-hairpin-helix domain-containing protein [Rhodoferax sp.]